MPRLSSFLLQLPFSFLLPGSLVFTALFLIAAAVPARGDDAASYQVLTALPHDPGAFTQGLTRLPDPSGPGRLFESTGRWGRSSIREIDPATGKILRSLPLDARHFGEGLAVWNRTLVQLTWKSETGFFRDPDTLQETNRFPYSGEGWGLALCPGPDNAPRLVRSDGTARLAVHDPRTFEEKASVDVTDNGQPVRLVNELECAGDILAFNVWHSDRAGLADPATGQVLAWIDFSSLRAHLDAPGGALNGLAWNPESRTMWVTGKNWDKMFEVRIPLLSEWPR